jgi:hypothetical protein
MVAVSAVEIVHRAGAMRGKNRTRLKNSISTVLESVFAL